MQTLDARIRKLERANLRWRILGIVAIGVLVYGQINGAEGTKVVQSVPNPLLTDNLQIKMPESINVTRLTAKHISVVDDRGQERMSLQLLEGQNPIVVLRDSHGIAKSYWTVDSSGRAQLGIRNNDSVDVALVAEHPQRDGGMIRVANSAGKVVTAITTDAEGNGMMGVNKRDGSRPIGLGFW